MKRLSRTSAPRPTASTPPIIMLLDVTREQDVEAPFARIGEAGAVLTFLSIRSPLRPAATCAGGPRLEPGQLLESHGHFRAFLHPPRAEAEPLMTAGGACLAVSFYGAKLVVKKLQSDGIGENCS